MEYNLTASAKLHKKALYYSYFTVSYNLVEGVVSIGAGFLAGSTALVGFGIDSFVESLSASIMIWRFRGHEAMQAEEEERKEQKALKFVAYAFFILGAYVLFESGKALYLKETPEHSLLGIIIAILSLIIMPILFWLKYKTGKALNSKSLIADSKQTLACVVLSAILLVGLGLNYFFNIWWADPIAGVIIALLLIREGFETLEDENKDKFFFMK